LSKNLQFWTGHYRMDVKLEKIILTDPPVDDCSTRSYPRTFHLQITDDMSEPDKAAGFENIRRTSYNNQSPQSKSSLGEMVDEESFQTNKKWSPTHRTRQHDRWKTMSKMLSGRTTTFWRRFWYQHSCLDIEVQSLLVHRFSNLRWQLQCRCFQKRKIRKDDI
jgi:hypothetical protein